MTPSSRQEDRRSGELAEFLTILEHRILALSRSATVLDRQGDHPPRFADYARTRMLTTECLAFSIVIERRVEMLPDPQRRSEAKDRFDSLTVLIWSTLMDCSLKFLRSIAEEEHLPLGSREVFLHEIKTLYDAHKILTSERYRGKVEEETLHQQKAAERILNEIIERAPRLLDLSSSPAS
ncbi:hypothetical protein [Rhodospirillum rubrum]|uniref:Uncharacterized protein n=1 Tax=Rhodospirillum rubrum (strain ATCC 11170 / ATH 1.1.1 / DSM 467 / LMG 4362 / NCIMB 8255 / S1) TaxID=269796 RepID=Q2RYG5_RHORT|nr:hypothetical protein [Rhodospirillum rubrum]ABC20830.1 hypothetical protein Rru_A0025 [Rhodospirillum rubrum ATCC 11170]AEO46497.1 hypothetical protein F11_00130 [Rhodospirillum rubrum F11]MBK5956353.1 hypothetical protein [Rhodospirillum rubrum]QXG80533.1 hypothetical protein KUL73_00130 [Rhodospirillum rubrum]HAQ00589.1 hypothetical protein [Rhodospirillum rubrum]